MALLIEVLAVIGVAVLVRGILQERSDALRLPLVIAAVAGIVGILAFGNLAWTQARNELTQRKANAKLTPTELRSAGGGAFPAREDILARVDDLVPRRGKVYLACRDPACAGGLNTWITYRLGPRVFTDRREDADWTLLYNASYADAGIRPSDLTDVTKFGPKFVLGRNR